MYVCSLIVFNAIEVVCDQEQGAVRVARFGARTLAKLSESVL